MQTECQAELTACPGRPCPMRVARCAKELAIEVSPGCSSLMTEMRNFRKARKAAQRSFRAAKHTCKSTFRASRRECDGHRCIRHLRKTKIRCVVAAMKQKWFEIKTARAALTKPEVKDVATQTEESDPFGIVKAKELFKKKMAALKDFSRTLEADAEAQ